MQGTRGCSRMTHAPTWARISSSMEHTPSRCQRQQQANLSAGHHVWSRLPVPETITRASWKSQATAEVCRCCGLPAQSGCLQWSVSTKTCSCWAGSSGAWWYYGIHVLGSAWMTHRVWAGSGPSVQVRCCFRDSCMQRPQAYHPRRVSWPRHAVL